MTLHKLQTYRLTVVTGLELELDSDSEVLEAASEAVVAPAEDEGEVWGAMIQFLYLPSYTSDIKAHGCSRAHARLHRACSLAWFKAYKMVLKVTPSNYIQ